MIQCLFHFTDRLLSGSIHAANGFPEAGGVFFARSLQLKD
jgi:hypothetical protein